MASASINVNPNRSVEVVEPPSDSVSSLCFSPKANLLVATSWNKQVRCWEVMRSGNTISTVPKASISHDQPVLCSAWKDDGTTVFSGGCDKQFKMRPLLSGGQPVTVAMHDAPVKEFAWILVSLVTGSWGKTLRYWDLRQQKPTWLQQLPVRCYALSVRDPLMVVVGTADRSLVVFNLQNTQVGSIEGRVGVQHLEESQSIGAFAFWDKDSKTKLKAMLRCNQRIPCSTFNKDGSIYCIRAGVL